jgi:hypothetical protein
MQQAAFQQGLPSAITSKSGARPLEVTGKIFG